MYFLPGDVSSKLIGPVLPTLEHKSNYKLLTGLTGALICINLKRFIFLFQKLLFDKYSQPHKLEFSQTLFRSPISLNTLVTSQTSSKSKTKTKNIQGKEYIYFY